MCLKAHGTFGKPVKAARFVSPSVSAYTAAKNGMVGLTKTAAVEYAEQGVRVNSVGPAFIHTPMISGVGLGPSDWPAWPA